MTGSSAGRSRAKNSISQVNVAAKEYVSSNSTSAMFLGGQQKSWMTGPRQVEISSQRTLPKTNNGRKSGALQERSGNQPSVVTTAGNLRRPAGASHYPPGNGQPPIVEVSLPGGSIGNTIQKGITGAVHNVETVLPSPAPSDEYRSDNIQAHVLEPDGRISNPHEGSFRTSSNVQLPGYGSTDELEANEHFERMLRDALSAMTPPASDAVVPQAQQQPIQLTGVTVARRTPHQGSSEKKRKRNDSVACPSGIGVYHSHSLPNTKSTSMTGTFEPSLQVPTSEQMHTFLQIVNDRQQQRAMISAQGDTEVARLDLLQRACNQNDHAYLLLHQIYCMDLTQADFLGQLNCNGFHDEHINGIGMLTPLLLPNFQRMAHDSVHWFAHFPLPFEVMLHEYNIYRKALESIKTCLALMNHCWLKYRESCSKRLYPPLVEELVETLGMESPVLQSVVFRAILKDMWMGDTTDWCFHEAEAMFQQNQLNVRQGRSQEKRKCDKQNIIIKYQQLKANHAKHEQNSNIDSTPNANSSAAIKTLSRTNPPTQVNPTSRGNPPSQPAPILAQGVLAGSKNHFSVRPPTNQRRAPPPPNINTEVAHLPATTPASVITPILPSRPILPLEQHPTTLQGDARHLSHLPSNSTASVTPSVLPSKSYQTSQQSPTTLSSNARGHLISPPNPAPSAALQASQARRPSLNGPSAMSSPYSSPYPSTSPHIHSLQGTTRSPAGRTGPWLVPPSSINRSHQISQMQANRPPSNRRPLDRATEMPRPGAVPHPGYRQLLLPPVGQIISTAAHPNPIVTALHQSQARSPFLAVVDDSGQPSTNTKYFRYVEGVAILHDRLQIGKRQHIDFNFSIGEDDRALLSGTMAGHNGAPSTRTVRLGSRFGRLRCVDVTRIADIRRDNQRAWVTAPQAWPEHPTVIFNGKNLDIRKKIHYGKDLPIDVTAAIQPGNNKFSVSIISSETEDKTEFAVGLETLQLVDTAEAKAMTGVLPYNEARQRVLRRLHSADPEIEVVNSSVVIDISDPYTSRIWDVPMRGRGCRHDQCFDLDVFLETRTSKRAGQPCDPDQFKCPICGGDARPQSLVKDEFFEVLRAELGKKNRLDAKAIVMQQNGSWEVQEEEKTGEAGDGSGRRSWVREESAASAGGSLPRQAEVIEIN
ncbi:MAG: hypothetical protein Q9209_004796 [Squamulea sp. 1 TL-2023]